MLIKDKKSELIFAKLLTNILWSFLWSGCYIASIAAMHTIRMILRGGGICFFSSGTLGWKITGAQIGFDKLQKKLQKMFIKIRANICQTSYELFTIITLIGVLYCKYCTSEHLIRMILGYLFFSSETLSWKITCAQIGFDKLQKNCSQNFFKKSGLLFTKLLTNFLRSLLW